MNVMIVVPHPDDEVLGFGGVIQKHAKRGDKILVYFITEIRNRIPSDQIRLESQIKQFPIVGEKLGYVGKSFETAFTDERFAPNVRKLEEEIETFKPDILYSVFGGDNHQDHEYIFKMLRIATRVWSEFLVKRIYIGEVLSSTDQAPRLPQFSFIPTHYVPLTKEEVDKKVECMKCYEDEIREWPHPRSEKGLFNLAERRGSECHSEYAEAFMTLRHIEDR